MRLSKRSANICLEHIIPADKTDSDTIVSFERKLDLVWASEALKYNADVGKITFSWGMPSGQDLDLAGEASA